jgi:hypothetical protein
MGAKRYSGVIDSARLQIRDVREGGGFSHVDGRTGDGKLADLRPMAMYSWLEQGVAGTLGWLTYPKISKSGWSGGIG